MDEPGGGRMKFTSIATTDNCATKCRDCLSAGRTIADCGCGWQPSRPAYLLYDETGAHPLCAWCANRNAMYELLMQGEVKLGGTLLTLPLPFPTDDETEL